MRTIAFSLALTAGLLLPSVAVVADDASTAACDGILAFDTDSSKAAGARDTRRISLALRQSEEPGSNGIARKLAKAKTTKKRNKAVLNALVWCLDKGGDGIGAATFEPQVLTGQGDSVVDVATPQDEPALAHIVGSGGGNLAVWSYDTLGNRLDLLVNTIGAYDGVRLINILVGEGVARLEIESDGPWSVEIAPLANAPRFSPPGHFDGSGDSVLILDESADTATFAAPGGGNFAVWAYTESDRDLLVNEIGPYSGTSIVPRDTFLLEVTAEGPWAVDFT